MKARLNITHPRMTFALKGAIKAEVVPAGVIPRAAAYTIPISGGPSTSTIAQMIAEGIAEDNAKDGEAFEQKVPNLLNIYRSAKL